VRGTERVRGSTAFAGDFAPPFVIHGCKSS
jgi:hypothetical protein